MYEEPSELDSLDETLPFDGPEPTKEERDTAIRQMTIRTFNDIRTLDQEVSEQRGQGFELKDDTVQEEMILKQVMRIRAAKKRAESAQGTGAASSLTGSVKSGRVTKAPPGPPSAGLSLLRSTQGGPDRLFGSVLKDLGEHSNRQ